MTYKNKEQQKEYYRLWSKANKDKIKKYRTNSKESNRKRLKKWIKKNQERARKNWRNARNNKTARDGGARLKLRFRLLQKFNFRCTYCGRGSKEVVLEIDHIIPKSKGGKDIEENYTTACRECNIGKRDIILDPYQ